MLIPWSGLRACNGQKSAVTPGVVTSAQWPPLSDGSPAARRPPNDVRRTAPGGPQTTLKTVHNLSEMCTVLASCGPPGEVTVCWRRGIAPTRGHTLAIGDFICSDTAAGTSTKPKSSPGENCARCSTPWRQAARSTQRPADAGRHAAGLLLRTAGVGDFPAAIAERSRGNQPTAHSHSPRRGERSQRPHGAAVVGRRNSPGPGGLEIAAGDARSGQRGTVRLLAAGQPTEQPPVSPLRYGYGSSELAGLWARTG